MKIVKIPYSGGNLRNNAGCNKGPDSVINQLQEACLENEQVLQKLEISEIKNAGDINKISEELKETHFDIALGGNNSVTYATFRNFADKHKNPGIIIFDAHPDIYGGKEPLGHRNYLHFLIEEGIIKTGNAIIVGLRTNSPAENEYYRKNRIKVFTSTDISLNMQDICDTVMENARSFDAFYISIDMNAIDPAFAPGTELTEPAGLTSREILYFIRRLKLLKNLKAADISGINPEKDVNNMTAKLGAKIILELL